MGLKDIFSGKRPAQSDATEAARLAALMYRRAAQADMDGDEGLAAAYRRVAPAEIDRVTDPYRQSTTTPEENEMPKHPTDAEIAQNEADSVRIDVGVQKIKAGIQDIKVGLFGSKKK